MADAKYWQKTFADILSYTLNLFSFTPADLADGFCDVTTVRKWVDGTRKPNAESQKHLIKFFKERIPADDSDGIFSLACEQIEGYLADTKLSSVRELKQNCNKSSAVLIANVLTLCFANMKKAQNESSKGTFKSAFTFSPYCFTTKEKIKAVVFDFDGTLTTSKLSRTTWEDIWVALGYDAKICQYYHKKFSNGEIDHKTWCLITESHFKNKHLHRSTLDSISSKIELLPGVSEVIELLFKNDIKIYIVSGSILHIIRTVLGKNYLYIDGIKSNQFFFNENGFLHKIVGTKYDFEGKCCFIQELANDLHISTENILFVGNSLNDEYAYISGAKTLCINPKYTDSSNTMIWHKCIEKCDDLREILPLIFEK